MISPRDRNPKIWHHAHKHHSSPTCSNPCGTRTLETFLLDDEAGTNEETGADSQGQALLVVG